MKKKVLILTPVISLLIGSVAYACVKPVDLCSNIEGNQFVVPVGDTASDGVCTPIPDVAPPPVTPPPDVQPVVTPAPVVDVTPPPLTAGK